MVKDKVKLTVDFHGLIKAIQRKDSTATYIGKEALKDPELSEDVKKRIEEALKG